MSARPERCIKCDHPMRGTRYTAAQRPGTRVHSGKGQCATCRRKELRAEQAKAAPPEPVYDLAHTIYGLNSWLANLPSRKTRT